MSRREFMQKNRHGNEAVVRFVADFLFGTTSMDISRQLTELFTNGYCYYFARMLQDTFKRGNIVVDKHGAHVAWRDVDGQTYDITGLTDASRFVPVTEKYLRIFLKIS